MTKKDDIQLLKEELHCYKEALIEITRICAPSPQGYFKRGAANECLGVAFDALHWPERQMVVVHD